MPHDNKVGVEFVRFIDVLRKSNNAKWKCPLCKAENDTQCIDGDDMYYCTTCSTQYRLSDVTGDSRNYMSFIQECEHYYKALQEGMFDEVGKWTDSQLNSISGYGDQSEDFVSFLQYLKFRAEFKILGPIVTADGRNTNVFTPCVIEQFTVEKIRSDDNFNKLKNNIRFLCDIAGKIEASATEYTNHWKAIKNGVLDDFDIFICHKTDDGGKENTEDYKIALQMYRILTAAGYRVFFAPETKKHNAKLINEYDSNWREWIYDALLTSEVMILIGTDMDYLYSPNVQNEWAMFRYFSQTKYYGAKRMLNFFSPNIACGKDSDLSRVLDVQENYYDSIIRRNGKVDKNAFLELIRKIDYGYFKEGLLHNPSMCFRFYDEDAELSKMRSEALAIDTPDERIIATATEVWKHYRSAEAALYVGLAYMRLANGCSEPRARTMCEKHYKNAYDWFCKTSVPKAIVYKAFCIYNGFGVERNEKLAIEMLSHSDDDVGKYYFALFVIKKYMECGIDSSASSISECERGVDRFSLGDAELFLKRLSDKIPEAGQLYRKCTMYGIFGTNDDDLTRSIL